MSAGRRGFTLIEILVVTLIIGLLMTAAVLSLDGLLPSSRLKRQVRQTAGLLELARVQAATEGRDIALVMDREKRVTRLERFVSDEEEDDTSLLQREIRRDVAREEEDREPLLESAWGEGLQLLEFAVDTGSLDDTRDFVLFTPQGYSDGVRLTWGGEGEAKQSLELWPLSGKLVIGDVKSGP